MNVRDIIRIKALSDIYGKLTDEDKQMLALISSKDNEISKQSEQIDSISRRIGNHPFASDLFANVVGNYITDGINYIVKTIAKRL